jgi:hypothetical protein
VVCNNHLGSTEAVQQRLTCSKRRSKGQLQSCICKCEFQKLNAASLREWRMLKPVHDKQRQHVHAHVLLTLWLALQADEYGVAGGVFTMDTEIFWDRALLCAVCTVPRSAGQKYATGSRRSVQTRWVGTAVVREGT